MKRLKNIVYFTITTVILCSCYAENEEELFPEVTVAKNASDSSLVVSFLNDIQPIINQNCAFSGCHASTNTYPLTNYAEVKVKVDDNTFRNRVVDQRNMPAPNGLADVNEVNLIRRWLDEGAKNN